MPATDGSRREARGVNRLQPRFWLSRPGPHRVRPVELGDEAPLDEGAAAEDVPILGSARQVQRVEDRMR
jgi:hypothetical protein